MPALADRGDGGMVGPNDREPGGMGSPPEIGGPNRVLPVEVGRTDSPTWRYEPGRVVTTVPPLGGPKGDTPHAPWRTHEVVTGNAPCLLPTTPFGAVATTVGGTLEVVTDVVLGMSGPEVGGPPAVAWLKAL